MHYIAGKIRGSKNYREQFAKAADQFRLQGFQVFNPAAAGLDDGRSLNDIMSYLLPRLCECDTIVMLKGWWRSGGARIEWLLALYLKKRIIYL